MQGVYGLEHLPPQAQEVQRVYEVIQDFPDNFGGMHLADASLHG